MSVLDIFKKKKNQEVNPTEDNATTADAKEDSTRQETPKSEITIKMQFGHEGEGRNVYVVGAGTIPEDERKYYNPDEYYQNYAYNGLVGDEILPFEQRKKTQKPSARGLYPAEIMLLQYCTFGSYPFPRNGYPGLWWYKYGIRDVISYLGSLEARGFLRRSTIDESLKKYQIAELQEILSAHGLETKGKKSVLIERIEGCIDYDDLVNCVTRYYYILTPLGWDELLNGQIILDINGIGETLNPRMDGLEIEQLHQINKQSK